jgi:hypothetical protein
MAIGDEGEDCWLFQQFSVTQAPRQFQGQGAVPAYLGWI